MSHQEWRYGKTLRRVQTRFAACAPFVLLLNLMLLFAAAANAATGDRVALVIGNGGYTHVQSLRNPARDAADFAGKLEDLGFDVILGIDADREQFGRLLTKTLGRATNASAVVFYYAGHGFELAGVNRLVPIDSTLRDRAKITAETIDMHDVIQQLSGTGGQLVVLLDACRNSPLPKGVAADLTGEGLAKIETGRDIFVAFATEPNQVAGDGKGRNSAFTKALLTHLDRPGLSISDMMVDVRRDVFASTKGKQLPWDQSSLKSAFYFAPEASDSNQTAGASRSGLEEDSVPESDGGSSQTNQLDALRSDSVLQPIETSDNEKPEQASSPEARQDESQVAKPATSPSAEKPSGTKDRQRPKKPAAAKETQKPKKPEKKTVIAPGASKKSPPINTGDRPSAIGYSFRIWREGQIPIGGASVSTPYGFLKCRSFENGGGRRGGRSVGKQNRRCWWKQ